MSHDVSTIKSLGPGLVRISVGMDAQLLPGSCIFDIGVHRAVPPWPMDYFNRVLSFEVLSVAAEGSDRYPYDFVRGLVRPHGRWVLEGAAEPGPNTASNPTPLG